MDWLKKHQPVVRSAAGWEWRIFKKIILESQHYFGKEFTTKIEQTNSDIRHDLARFRRKTKVVSQSETIVNLTLKLHLWLRKPENFQNICSNFHKLFA